MKCFLILIVASICTAGVILCSITFILLWRFEHADYHIPDNKHILAIGPSTTTYALNDSIIPGLCNISQNGAAHYALYPTLKRVIEQNHQIDTVWINHGRFQVFRVTDDFGPTSSLQYMRTMLLFMLDNGHPDVRKFFKTQPMFYAALLTPDLLNLSRRNINDYGFHHSNLYGEGIIRDSIGLFASQDKEMDRVGGKNLGEEWIYYNCWITHSMTLEMIKLCEEHNIVPVLFNTPLYKYDRWCSKLAYYDYIQNLHSSPLIADYEDFQFNDISYWKDVIHLNSKGADSLSTNIASHGLKVQTLYEYISSHK